MMYYTLSLKDTVVNVILAIGQGLKDFFSWIIGFLPDDPFDLNEVLTVPQVVRDVCGFVNWLVPIRRCLQLVLAWITLILAIWFVRVLLKLAHII